MFERAKGFVSYWFLRYLLVTEMYMIERWERVVVHIFLFIFFAILGLFNAKVLLTLTEYLTAPCFATTGVNREISSTAKFLSASTIEASQIGEL